MQEKQKTGKLLTTIEDIRLSDFQILRLGCWFGVGLIIAPVVVAFFIFVLFVLISVFVGSIGVLAA